MSPEKYSYIANIAKAGDVYTVRFPQFNIEGKGFRDHGDTLKFAEDMLSEIVMDYQEKEKPLPRQDRHDKSEAFADRNDGTASADEVLITADVGTYKSRIEKNSKKVFYEFENKGDLNRENESDDASGGRSLGAWWKDFRSRNF